MADQLIKVIAHRHFRRKVAPRTPGDAFRAAHCGVVEPTFQRLIHDYPDSAFYRHRTKVMVGLLLQGPGQDRWLTYYTSLSDQPNSGITFLLAGDTLAGGENLDELLRQMEPWERLDALDAPRVTVVPPTR